MLCHLLAGTPLGGIVQDAILLKFPGGSMKIPYSVGLKRLVCPLVLVALLLSLGNVHSWAQQNNQQQMRGLDEQVQEIKSDVLSIAAELSRLEEKLLYPSDTQVAVFVALATGDQMR